MGSQPASLSGNTYQYESAMSGPTPAGFHKGGKYIKFSRRRRRGGRGSRRRGSRSRRTR
jgi:uncharacterized protein affecting Mg2+/Co2+ transport